MSRTLDYIDARMMAKAIARWRVAGDLSDEELSEDTLAARYLNRRIAEQTEVFVPDAVAAIKALGAEPAFTSEIVLEATGGQFKNLAEVLAHVRRVVGPASAPSEEST